MGVFRMVCMISPVVAVVLLGCAQSEDRDSGLPSDASVTQQAEEVPGADSTKPVGRAVDVIEIIEINQDGFPERLSQHNEDDEPTQARDDHGLLAPFQIYDDRLVISHRRSADEELEPDIVQVDRADGSLEDCPLLVLHSVRYAGGGRHGVENRYFGFTELNGKIGLIENSYEQTFEYDLARHSVPFDDALKQVRLFPKDAASLQLRITEDEKTGEPLLELAFGQQHQQLKAGESTEFSNEQRTLVVREKALSGSSVTDSDDVFDPNPPVLSGDVVISRAVDHGPIKFSTKLTIVYHGRLPTTTSEPATELEEF